MLSNPLNTAPNQKRDGNGYTSIAPPGGSHQQAGYVSPMLSSTLPSANQSHSRSPFVQMAPSMSYPSGRSYESSRQSQQAFHQPTSVSFSPILPSVNQGQSHSTFVQMAPPMSYPSGRSYESSGFPVPPRVHSTTYVGGNPGSCTACCGLCFEDC